MSRIQLKTNDLGAYYLGLTDQVTITFQPNGGLKVATKPYGEDRTLYWPNSKELRRILIDLKSKYAP